jgi:multiple sugar transport system permease protein
MGSSWTKAERKRQLLGLIFTGPWILGFLVFAFYPVLASLYYSLCDYNVFDAPVFNAGHNYVELVRDDKLFWRSLWNTAYFMFFAIPTTMVTALVLAMLLNLKVRGQAFYRTVFFLPSIVPIVASTVLWLWILNPRYGLANKMLTPISPYLQMCWDHFRSVLLACGVSPSSVPELRFPPGWLSNEYWSKPGLIVMSIWGVGNNMILYLASLQEVPKELYEAAELDGASAWRRTRHITLPMISPILFFTLVMGMIGTFQYFTQAFIMTDGGGGPNDSTLFYAMYLFNNAFIYFKMGYASAMAWILFVLILICTALTFRLTRGKVYYAGA